MKIQIPNEKANEFEDLAVESFSQMNPVRIKKTDFWTTFEFDTVTTQEDQRICSFADECFLT